MEIVEYSCTPKWPGTPGDDVVCITPGFVAIIDGSTSKGDESSEVASGTVAAEAIARKIAELDREIRLEQFVEQISRAAEEASSLLSPPGGWKWGAPSASIVALSVHRREVWAVGDGWWASEQIVTKLSHPFEDLMATVRAAYLEALLRSGAAAKDLLKHDPGRELIMPLLRSEHQFRNDPISSWGFGAVDGSSVPPAMMLQWNLKPTETEVILASDGFPKLGRTLSESEEMLQECLASDPLMIGNYRATKGLSPGSVSYDDRSFVRIRI
jgi:hypothetical protein